VRRISSVSPPRSRPRRARRERRRRVEFGADLGPRRAFAHHAGVAAAAQRELQRIDQDGLAGTGLTREHRETGVELDLQRRDDDEVAQGQTAQHAALGLCAAPGNRRGSGSAGPLAVPPR
jgi:hypothetical protein